MTTEVLVRQNQQWKKATTLSKNWLVAVGQLLMWFLLRPSGWHNFVAQDLPDLSPNFCLAELKVIHWRQPTLLRLLGVGYLMIPSLLGGVMMVSIYLFSTLTPIALWGIVAGILTGLLVGMVLSTVAGIFATFTTTIMFVILLGVSDLLIIDVVITQFAGIFYGIIAGSLGYAAAFVTSKQDTHTLSQRFGGILMGIGICLALISGVAWVSYSAINGFATEQINMVTVGIAAGSFPSIVFWLTIAARTGHWRKANQIGGISILVMVLLGIIVFTQAAHSQDIGGKALISVVMMTITMVFITFYLLTFVIATRLAGVWAGLTAGTIAGIAGYSGLAIVFSIYDTISNLWAFLITFLLILLIPLWRPLLFYPFMLAWHTLLYQTDKERTHPPFVLRWHAAFWDEQQYLPFYDLPNHVLMLLRHTPSLSAIWLNKLQNTPQHWAVPRIQIELDARQLESYASLTEMKEAHLNLGSNTLRGEAAHLMQSFSHISHDIDAALQQSSHYNQRLILQGILVTLNGLLQELTRSQERYSPRFRPIVTKWYQLVSNHIKNLNSIQEINQEIENPYVVGMPLNIHQEVFVGREKVSRRLEELVLSEQSPPLLLYGQRRMGKTSLLNNLGRLLPRRIMPLFVDLQGPTSFASDHAGFLYNIARDMRASAEQQRGVILPALSRQTLHPDPFTNFDLWLDAIETSLLTQPDHRILLAFDEFEALDTVLTAGYFDENAILSFLRHLIQHRTRFKVLLSGSHTLAGFERWASYLINAQVIPITFLEKDEAVQLIKKPIRGFSLQYSENAVSDILHLTAHHPFLLQLVCSELVVYKNQQPLPDRHLACTADIRAILSGVIQRGTLFFTDIERNQVDSFGREALKFMARFREGVNDIQFQAEFADNNKLEKTLINLQERKLIERRVDTYIFSVELVRIWFNRLCCKKFQTQIISTNSKLDHRK